MSSRTAQPKLPVEMTCVPFGCSTGGIGALDRIILDLDFFAETYPPSAEQEGSAYERPNHVRLRSASGIAVNRIRWLGLRGLLPQRSQAPTRICLAIGSLRSVARSLYPRCHASL